ARRRGGGTAEVASGDRDREQRGENCCGRGSGHGIHGRRRARRCRRPAVGLAGSGGTAGVAPQSDAAGDLAAYDVGMLRYVPRQLMIDAGLALVLIAITGVPMISIYYLGGDKRGVGYPDVPVPFWWLASAVIVAG